MLRMVVVGLVAFCMTVPVFARDALDVLADVLGRKGLTVSDIMPDQVNPDVDRRIGDATMMIGCAAMMGILIVEGVEDKRVAANMIEWSGALHRETMRQLARVGLPPRKIDNLHDVIATITLEKYQSSLTLPDAAACRSRAEAILVAEAQPGPPVDTMGRDVPEVATIPEPVVPVSPSIAAPVAPALREFPVDLRGIGLTSENDGQVCSFVIDRTVVSDGETRRIAEGTFEVDQGYLVNFDGRWDTDKAAGFDGFKLAITEDGKLVGDATVYPLYSHAAKPPAFDRRFLAGDVQPFSNGSVVGKTEFSVDKDKLAVRIEVTGCERGSR